MTTGAQQASVQDGIPRVLLLTGTPPGVGSVGELFLRDLCVSYPPGFICCYALIPGNHPVSPAPELHDLPIIIRQGRREHVYASIAGKAGRLIALEEGTENVEKWASGGSGIIKKGCM